MKAERSKLSVVKENKEVQQTPETLSCFVTDPATGETVDEQIRVLKNMAEFLTQAAFKVTPVTPQVYEGSEKYNVDFSRFSVNWVGSVLYMNGGVEFTVPEGGMPGHTTIMHIPDIYSRQLTAYPYMMGTVFLIGQEEIPKTHTTFRVYPTYHRNAIELDIMSEITEPGTYRAYINLALPMKTGW